ncbi:hypothetical protein QJS10_CPB21g01580 [Acorus calamus]|uniref:Uncharacterized protein n=1 Tax=Acorus calamus TaxID=4465 RepID=A0AAV9C746_ACOCL|nr:hypothetical protein QJS10_CPB21g01580 [Acorus calamus]
MKLWASTGRKGVYTGFMPMIYPTIELAQTSVAYSMSSSMISTTFSSCSNEGVEKGRKLDFEGAEEGPRKSWSQERVVWVIVGGVEETLGLGLEGAFDLEGGRGGKSEGEAGDDGSAATSFPGRVGRGARGGLK